MVRDVGQCRVIDQPKIDLVVSHGIEAQGEGEGGQLSGAVRTYTTVVFLF